MKKGLLILFYYFLIAINGCGFAPMGKGPIFTNSAPSSEKAKVVHYRIRRTIGNGAYFLLYMNDQFVTGIGNGGYYEQELTPGEYTCYIRFQNYTPVFALVAAIDNARAVKLHEFTFNAKSGEIYYFRWNAAGKPFVDKVEEQVALKELNGLRKFQVPKEKMARFISLGKTHPAGDISDGGSVAPTGQKNELNKVAERGPGQSSNEKKTDLSMANNTVNSSEEKSNIQEKNIFMSQSNLEQLFNTDRTAVFKTTGHTCTIWYYSDGNQQVQCNEFMDTGKYRITESQYCGQWKKLRGGKEACFKFAKVGENTYNLLKADSSLWGTLEFK